MKVHAINYYNEKIMVFTHNVVEQEREPSPQSGTEESHDMKRNTCAATVALPLMVRCPGAYPAHLGIEEGARHHQ